MTRIALPTLIIFISTLIAAVVLTVTGHGDAAGPLYGVAIGVVSGTAATTGVIAQQVNKGNGTGLEEPPVPAP